MTGFLALVLHAHLPFVRHPEHARSLEEIWLFEAITESYVPLLRLLEDWRRDGLEAPVTLTLSPTLCAMLRDPLLQERYVRHLDSLLDLAGKEIYRTLCEPAFQEVARFYQERWQSTREYYLGRHGDLVGAFGEFQDQGRLEIITTAATHALVDRLFASGVLVVGLTFPVVPQGDETIRFQINAAHTEADIAFVLDLLAK